MGFFQMQFESRDALERAFATVVCHEAIEFCSADSARLRLRFRASRGLAGPLLERLGIERLSRPPSSRPLPPP